MKFRNWFLSFAVLAGLAATAAEAVPEPEKTPAAEAGASAPALELPPRIGLVMKSSDPDDGTHGTVGVSLTGVPAGQYFGGLQLGFFGENFEFHNSYGIWAGWYGEMQRQKGLQFAFTNVAWKYATGQFALGGNFAELCEGVQAAGLVNSAPELAGTQLAGFGNMAGTANGFQLAALLNQAEYGSGVQLALFNVTGAAPEDPMREPAGQRPGFVVQVGLENYSVDRKVFQLGLYNIKTEPGFQIGLLNRSTTGWISWLPFINW